MANTYYVHEIYGKRIDGTTYSTACVECINERQSLPTIPDRETKYYTENHRYTFPGTKAKCEEFVKALSSESDEKHNYGGADWAEYAKDGIRYTVDYKFDKGLKRITERYESKYTPAWEHNYAAVTVSLDTGEAVVDEDDYYYRQYLKAKETIEKFEELTAKYRKNG